MSETKHTPGPWHISQPPIVRKLACVINLYANSGIIASLFRELDDVPEDEFDIAEHKANARLIAAAPELLEALEEVLVMWHSPKPKKLDETLTWRENDERALAKAEAAIRKANRE